MIFKDSEKPRMHLSSIKFLVDNRGRNTVEIEYYVMAQSDRSGDPKLAPVYKNTLSFPIEDMHHFKTIDFKETDVTTIDEAWDILYKVKSLATKIVTMNMDNNFEVV